jgi:8-oxo-dGTP pyrophosphatase MutT (NUDIX family)
MQTVEVHETKPETFNPQTEVAACYLECDGKLLLLLNALGDSEAGSWGVPAGKLESNEAPLHGAARELYEETSISIEPSQIQSIGCLYIRKPEVDYIYHLFRIKIATRPEVRLSPEHQNYRWVSAEEMEMMPIMIGGKEAYARYRTLAAKKRIGASVNAYIISSDGGLK